MEKDKILEIKNLHVHYITEDETVKAVNGVNLSLKQGESLGLVGETGAGKSTTALAIMQLVPYPPGIITQGEIIFQGKNLIYNTEKENQQMRGNGISMIFQDPMTSLNPIMTIGEQLLEVVMTHKKLNKEEGKKLVLDLLKVVGVKEDRYNDYPHQFSGGMKQRVVITMALLCNPQLLIADEPTTALDVTIQAQVLKIISDLQSKYNMAMILITHDLGVVAETCDHVAIMYAGEIMEKGTVKEVYTNAKHPYTRGLFESIPKLDEDSEKLIPIPGSAPNSADLPTGCPFHPRCKYKQDICAELAPTVKGKEHQYKCHFSLFENGEGN
ncbi:ABC transporter ATP-binding protein [Tissierella carlieri]|uniref:ABC transporter ATP-binding protein n=1 Tax=Tissierella carlieri TaxID=689904 RepID=A0ABT1S974_9FIRM|nr:ABC transporter ATP-binding protein [Tissierella carlieri]MBU5313094.1 ABC transporter ATP-binding protein [Tissierella carlieri]MCQ4923021.1 ABC transporter ATP-binding protein [Tissierella carlieri]